MIAYLNREAFGNIKDPDQLISNTKLKFETVTITDCDNFQTNDLDQPTTKLFSSLIWL